MIRSLRLLGALALLLGCLGSAGSLQAQSNWQPTAPGTYDWSNIANWAGGIPDSDTATANFTAVLTGNQTINLTADRILNVLNIGSAGGTYTLAGTQTLTLGGTTPAIAMAAGAQNVFLNMNTLAFQADSTITNSSTTGTLNIGVAGTGQIANATFNLTFGGPGNTTVNSVFTGTTGTITKTGTGILTFTDANAFGTANSTSVYGTVTTGDIAVNGGEMIVQNLRLTAPGMNGNRANGTNVSRNVTIATNSFLTVNGTLTADPSDNVYVTQIDGLGTLQLRNGTSTLTNPSLANDWGPSGGDANPWGSVVNAPVNVGTGTHWFVGKTNRNDVSRYAGDFRFDAPLSGTGNIQVRGLNNNSSRNWHLVFNANNSAFTGAVSIANADLNLTNANALTAANPVTFNTVVDANTQNQGVLYLWGHSVTIGTLNDLNTAGTTSFIRNGARDLANGGTNANNNGATNGVALGLQQDSVLTISQSAAGTFHGIIADGPNDNSTGDAGPYRTMGIVKTGAATLTLTGASTYTGPTTMNAGILSVASLSNGGVAGPLGGATVAASNLTFTGGTLQFTGATGSTDRGFALGTGGGTIEVTTGTATFTGTVTGSTALAKTGPGTLVLGGAAANYTGPVNVNGGTLRVAPNASSGQYTVATGAQLTVATAGAPGTLPATSVALANGSQLNLNYNQAGNPTAAFLNVSATNGFSVTAGTAQIDLVNPAGFTVGTFPLIDYAGSIGGAGFAGLQLAPSRLGASLVNNLTDTRVDLTIATLSDSITWTGAINGTWDIGTSVNVGGTNNWRLTTAGTATNFVNGDTVIFPATGVTNANVTINAAVSPVSTTVDSAATPYTFQGTAGIAGSGSLTKTGSSILTVLTANTYSGGTTIAAGAGNGISIGNGGTTGSIAGNVTNNQELIFNRSDATAFGGIISGSGTLEKLGAGSLALTGANTFTGRTTVSAGTLTINGDAALGTAPGAAVANQLTIAGGATLQVSATTTLPANRGVTLGTGTVTLDTQATTLTVNGIVTGPATLVKNGTGTLALTAANPYSGGTTSNAGALHFTTGSSLGTGTISFGTGVLSAAGLAGSPPTPFLRNTAVGDVTLANSIVLPSPVANTTYTFMKNSSGGQIDFTGVISGGSANMKLFLNSSVAGDTTTTYRFSNANTFVAAQIEIWRGGVVIGNMAGLGAATNQLVMDSNNNTTLGDLRFAVGGTFPNPVNLISGGGGSISTNANNVDFTGVLSGANAMLKLGTGIMTLSGTNTHTGGVTVSEGTLRVNGNSTAATGAITVNAGAAFGGTGTVGGAVTFAAGSTLAPGASIGTTTVANSVTINGNAAPNPTQWQVELNGIATNSLATADQTNVDRLVLTGAGSNLNFVTSATNRVQLNLQQTGGAFTFNGNPVFYRIGTANAGSNIQTNAGAFDSSHFDFVATGFTATNFNLQVDGNHLVVSFVPVPEPATLLGLSALTAAAIGYRRRSVA